jgi:hypothetical protein
MVHIVVVVVVDFLKLKVDNKRKMSFCQYFKIKISRRTVFFFLILNLKYKQKEKEEWYILLLLLLLLLMMIFSS